METQNLAPRIAYQPQHNDLSSKTTSLAEFLNHLDTSLEASDIGTDLRRKIGEKLSAHNFEQASIDEDMLDEITVVLAGIVDEQSSFTLGHSRRVANYSNAIARSLGLEASHRRWLRRAAMLHDIGKLAISNQILDKPDRLDIEDWRLLRKHPLYSGKILAGIPLFQSLAPIAAAHHERIDGKGYPHGLKADTVSFEIRILTVADVFDALTVDRAYRPAMSVSDAMAVIENGVGGAFDGQCVKALRRCIRKTDIDVAA